MLAPSEQPLQVVWFKRDLRVADHTPLSDAAAHGPVLPLYIVEPELWRADDASGRQWAFARDSLHKLGSAVATKMAAEQQDELAVILEAPMTSVLEVAQDQFWFVPVRYLMKDTFRSDQRINKINSPLLIIHGMEDTTIPIEYGMRLFDMADDPKQRFWMPGTGHVNAYEQGAGPVVINFIQDVIDKAGK